jgi:hypothetical protein
MQDVRAEVIQIEAPRRDSPARHHSPLPNEEPRPEKRGLFLYLNTGEKGSSMEVSAHFTSRGAHRHVRPVGCSLVLSDPGAKLVANQRGESFQRGTDVIEAAYVARCKRGGYAGGPKGSLLARFGFPNRAFARKARWKGHVRKEARLLELDTPFKLDKRPPGF